MHWRRERKTILIGWRSEDSDACPEIEHGFQNRIGARRKKYCGTTTFSLKGYCSLKQIAMIYGADGYGITVHSSVEQSVDVKHPSTERNLISLYNSADRWWRLYTEEHKNVVYIWLQICQIFRFLYFLYLCNL